MMVPKKSLILAGAALALFGATSSAQSQSGKVFARYNKPLKSATLDLATGTLTHGPVVSNRAPTTITDFANNDLGGFVGVDSGGGFCEWFDAGVKGFAGNGSDLMNSIVFAYCSAALTPGSGGVGGTMNLGFWEGYTLGGGASTNVAQFTLTGLPANTASSSFFGGFSCFFIRIFFNNLICFADGAIGYSWQFLDNGTGTINPVGAVLAQTWPFLSCVVSCSGAIGQVDAQGMTDMIDQYCPQGFLNTTFTFGTTSGSFTSMSMAIEEVTDKAGSVAKLNSATFPNPDTLCADVANVGQPWTASLTLGLARSKGSSWIMFFGGATADINIPQFTSGLNFGTNKNGRRLLCPQVGGLTVTTAHTGVNGSMSTSAATNIPKLLALVCNPWCGQAAVLGPVGAGDGGGNARLSSAVSGVVGTN
jgi:hypothetical protein